ncbi:hypothetical protein, partial [Corynebacterium striatum]|uniref:hypothetical protein n=1 Tax=Corynebacterium striatum TaxID=43770 RepID=UPI003F822F77
THAYTLRGPSTKECPKTTPGTRYPHRSVLDTALPVLNSVARHCNGTGVIYVEFGFMGCVDVPCEVCEGRSLIRFPAESVSASSSPRELVAQKEPLTSRYLAECVA